jgi:hypothetical protein
MKRHNNASEAIAIPLSPWTPDAVKKAIQTATLRLTSDPQNMAWKHPIKQAADTIVTEVSLT